MSKRTAFTQAFGASFWNAAGIACSLVTGILTARLLAPEDRGLVSLFLILAAISYLFSSVGSNTAYRTFQPRESWSTLRSYLQLSLILFFLNLVVSLLAVLAFAWVVSGNFADHLFLVVALSSANFASGQLLDVFNAVGDISLSALGNSLGHFVTMVFLLFIFFSGIAHTITGVSFAYVMGFSLRALFLAILIRIRSFEMGKGSKLGRKKLFQNGVRFWGMGLGQTLTFRADQVLLGVLSSPYSVGLYAVALTPASLMQVVSNSIGQVAFREAATGVLNLRRLFGFVGASIGITAAYGVLLWVTAPFLIPFVFGSSFEGSVDIVRVLLVGELFLGPYLVLVRALAGMNQSRFSSLSGFVGLALMIPAASYFVPIYGAVGAALGAVISYFGMLLFVCVGFVWIYRAERSRQIVSS